LSQTPSEPVPVEGLLASPYLQVLTYPRVSISAARGRVKQLQKLGVTEVMFEGRSKIGSLGILGLGTVSLVLKGKVAGRVVALKIRRRDANRPSMKSEFELTRFANRVGVGAQVYAQTRDLLVMEFIDSQELHDWFRSLSGRGRRDTARGMAHRVLNQCRTLDLVHLDHGELSDLRKHVVVTKNSPVMLDFESASRNRAPRNVTSAAQSLFVGGRMAPFVRRLLGSSERKRIIEQLHDYKKDQSDLNYESLLQDVGVLPKKRRPSRILAKAG
jgi:putative serine/threonine protein kinase